MNININIEDYLDESEIKEIVEDELRDAVAQQLRTNREIDTCITNISYRYVWDMVNDLYKEYDVDFEKLLLEKIKGIIDGLTSYSVFREANAYGDKIKADTTKFYAKDVPVRCVEIQIGDRFHFDEEDDWSLFQAQNYLELEYHPNDFYNYEVVGFKKMKV